MRSPDSLRYVRLNPGEEEPGTSLRSVSCLADRSVRFFALRATIAHPSGRFACASLHSWAQKSSVGEREEEEKRGEVKVSRCFVKPIFRCGAARFVFFPTFAPR